jgi:hypothetical protein
MFVFCIRLPSCSVKKESMSKTLVEKIQCAQALYYHEKQISILSNLGSTQLQKGSLLVAPKRYNII